MVDEPKEPEEHLDDEDLPDREARPLLNPAPGDMPIDPPLTPGQIGPLEDID